MACHTREILRNSVSARNKRPHSRNHVSRQSKLQLSCLSHGMRNECALRSRTGVRASLMALTFASSRRAVPHATAHNAVHGAFMTLPPYTRIREGEVHELGRGVRNWSRRARSRPLSEPSERIERECPATSAEGTAGSRIPWAFHSISLAQRTVFRGAQK